MKKLILGALLLLSMVSFGQEKFKTNYCINDDPVIVSALGMTYKLEMEYEVTDSTLTFIQVDKAILKHYQKNNLPLRSTLKVQLVSNNNVGNSNIKVYKSEGGDTHIRYTITRINENCYVIVSESVDSFTGKVNKITSVNTETCK